MKIAYLDCPSGISGDMTLGALVDSGVSLEAIQSGIDSLGLPDCRLEAETVKRRGFRALKVHVRAAEEQAHRHLRHITDMIHGSQLTPTAKDLATRMFQRLAEAEARVHGTTIEKVHFHEVGAADSIADLVGSAIGFDLLGVERVVASPIPTGSGTIEIAHGRVSVPAPATAELLRGVPIAESAVEGELTTPTGAAIVTTLAQQFGPVPSMTIEQIGYGAGSKDFEDRPNILRLAVGETSDSATEDEIWTLETNLDDVSGELVGHCISRLFEAGALDAYTSPIYMKKNRPAVTLSVLCHESDRNPIEDIIFQETTALGIRRWRCSRRLLAREPFTVQTPWGEILGKIAVLDNGTQRFSPEYDSCREAAHRAGVSLQDVYRAACQAFFVAHQSGETG